MPMPPPTPCCLYPSVPRLQFYNLLFYNAAFGQLSPAFSRTLTFTHVCPRLGLENRILLSLFFLAIGRVFCPLFSQSFLKRLTNRAPFLHNTVFFCCVLFSWKIVLSTRLPEKKPAVYGKYRKSIRRSHIHLLRHLTRRLPNKLVGKNQEQL